MDKIFEYIEGHRDEYIGLLQTLCRQPSIAVTHEGIDDMVKLVKNSLRSVGAEPIEYTTPGNPVIYAEIKGESDRIFGFYDHYDVQPVDPISLWNFDPYSAEIKDGNIYARGVADNKNGLASKICAVDAFQKVYGKLPCGVKFFVEGEEEIGSPNLEDFAQKHEDLLICDGFNWESGWKETGCPAQIDFGVKGLLYVELRIKTAKMNAHSCYAAIVQNPAWRLIWALSTIKGRDDRVLIEGFYDDIAPLTHEDIEILSEDNFSAENLKKYLGIDGFINGLSGTELLKKLYYEPTANICGLFSGYSGEGSNTILPDSAGVKIDFRLVPGQNPEKIMRLLREHLDRHGFEDVEAVEISRQQAFRSDPNSPFGRAVVKALGNLFGKPVIHHTVAGTSPIPYFCAKHNIPAALFGATSCEANIHAPNEHLDIDSYIDEIKMIAAVMDELSKS